LLFNRSFDWCPYCKAQLKDLVKQAPGIEALGFSVATITYDPVATLMEVAEDETVSFPLLHDEAAEHVNAYGILNVDYEPGHRAYGVPEPGILIIGPDGTILSKFSEEDYRVRPDFADVLDALKAL
jgi:peroxiredoxin